MAVPICVCSRWPPLMHLITAHRRAWIPHRLGPKDHHTTWHIPLGWADPVHPVVLVAAHVEVAACLCLVLSRAAQVD